MKILISEPDWEEKLRARELYSEYSRDITHTEIIGGFKKGGENTLNPEDISLDESTQTFFIGGFNPFNCGGE